jgi:hypothetical protein
MSEEDRNYYRRRAEEEVEWARASADARSVRLHYLLATAYLDRAYGQEGEPSRRP